MGTTSHKLLALSEQLYLFVFAFQAVTTFTVVAINSNQVQS
ncbi:hypothetical protein QSI75_26645 [Escherichia coli]|nr:hypothetical protein [Escherichia coli]